MKYDYTIEQERRLDFNLELAIGFAALTHSEQVDKAGQPYILHPLRVMLKMTTRREQIIAVLHDALEDGKQDPEWVIELFDDYPEIVEALNCLTHKDKAESYEDYIKRVATNPLAINVKLADLEDNMDKSRLMNMTEKDHQRLAKYQKAKDYLLEVKEKTQI